MEKYGVVLDQDLTKTASETQTCPECGTHLNDQGFCDRHGSAPFEKKAEKPQRSFPFNMPRIIK